MRVSIVRRQRDDGKGMEAQTVKLTADRPEDIPFLHDLILDAEKHNEDLAPDDVPRLSASREYEAARVNRTAELSVPPLTNAEILALRDIVDHRRQWDAENRPMKREQHQQTEPNDAPQQS